MRLLGTRRPRPNNVRVFVASLLSIRRFADWQGRAYERLLESTLPAWNTNRIARMVGIGLVLAPTAGTMGCGKSASDPDAVRIGQIRIEPATVRHWERAISLRAAVTSSYGRSRASQRAQALDFLISSHWLIGEAARQGLALPLGAVRRRMEERLSALSHASNINRALAATGRTISDVEFEARAALAAVKLRETIFSHVPAATEAEIVRYYQGHRQDLFGQERRVVDLIETPKSRSAAISLASRLNPGQPFAKRAIHETVDRPTLQEEERNLNGHLVRAIFAAPLNRTAGPVSYFGKWVIFVVRGVERTPLGLPEATGSITETLLRIRRQHALKAFANRYRREWRSETICRTGFVVSECSESRHALAPEATPLLGV
jgi:hypothetical protein